MFKNAYLESLAHYASPARSEANWLEIEMAYTHQQRHYHTLDHLNHLYRELLPFKEHFQDWDSLIFAIAYHDIIYSVMSSDNEEKSAEFANETLMDAGVGEKQRSRCVKLILATKRHEHADPETNLFTDGDLSILGSAPEHYLRYSNQVRKEYGIFPDHIYKPGRKNVLQRFLSMNRIYKTDLFYEKYEAIARQNIFMELSSLG